MNKGKRLVIISPLAGEPLKDYLRSEGFSLGYTPLEAACLPKVDPAIALHPDIYLCRLSGISEGSEEEGAKLFYGDTENLGASYPEDVRYCACSTGRYFLHRLKYSDPGLLKAAESLGLELVDIPQGYAKCNIAVVDEGSVITSDEGIARAAGRHLGEERERGLELLLIRPGHIELPGHPYGFIGGASGLLPPRAQDSRHRARLVFNGDLSAHPDFEKIAAFCEARGVECVYFKEYRLRDIGSIIYA